MKKVLSNYEFEEMCPVIYQKVLNDAKKVFEICQDDNINFHDYQSLYKFIQLYYCQEETKDKKKCDNSIAEYLKKIKKKKIYIKESKRKKNIHLRCRNHKSCLKRINH